jgi:hypothetical protein
MSGTTTVYLLWHSGADPDSDDALLLGVYSSEATAKERIDRSKDSPGFVDYPAGFQISPYAVDHDEWPEGFTEYTYRRT